MNREEAREAVRDRADIKRETARYPDTEINRYLNTGNRRLHSLLVTHGVVRDESIQTISADGSATYNLAANHLRTLNVWRDTGCPEPLMLDRHTFMDRPHGAAAATTGHACSYRIAKSVGQKTIELWPRPASGTYLVSYVAKIDDLADDADELVSALGYDDEFPVLYAAIQCLRKEGSSTKDLEDDLNAIAAQIIEDAQSEEESALKVRDVRSTSNSHPHWHGDWEC